MPFTAKPRVDVKQAAAEFDVLRHARQYLAAVYAEWDRLWEAWKSFTAAAAQMEREPEMGHLVKAYRAAARCMQDIAEAASLTYGASVGLRPPLTIEGGITLVIGSLEIAMAAAENIVSIIARVTSPVPCIGVAECRGEITDLCVSYLVERVRPRYMPSGMYRLPAVSRTSMEQGIHCVVAQRALERSFEERRPALHRMSMVLPGQDVAVTHGVRKDKRTLGAVDRVHFPMMTTFAGMPVIAPSVSHVQCVEVHKVTDWTTPAAAWASVTEPVIRPREKAWVLHLGSGATTALVSGGPPHVAEALISRLADSAAYAKFVWDTLLAPGEATAPQRVHSMPLLMNLIAEAARELSTVVTRDPGMGTAASRCTVCDIGLVCKCVGFWHIVFDDDSKAKLPDTLNKEHSLVNSCLTSFRLMATTTEDRNALLLLPLPPPPEGAPPPPADCFVAVSSVAVTTLLGDRAKASTRKFSLDAIWPVTVVRVMEV